MIRSDDGGFRFLVGSLVAFVLIAFCLLVVLPSHCGHRPPHVVMETNRVFAEIRTALDRYHEQHGTYRPTGSVLSEDNAFFPQQLPDASKRRLITPSAWESLGIRLLDQEVYCRYAIAASGPEDLGKPWRQLPGFTRGAEVFGIPDSPKEPWYYLRAQCNPGERGLKPSDPNVWQEWLSRFDSQMIWMREGIP